MHFLARPVVCPYFCFKDLVSLTIGLAIGDALLIVGKVAFGLTG